MNRNIDVANCLVKKMFILKNRFTKKVLPNWFKISLPKESSRIGIVCNDHYIIYIYSLCRVHTFPPPLYHPAMTDRLHKEVRKAVINFFKKLHCLVSFGISKNTFCLCDLLEADVGQWFT